MQMGGVMAGIYTVCDWIWKMALINILWILFTLTGLIIFGIVPATVAVFTIVRKWHMKEMDIPIFRTFFESYKREFMRANIVGLVMAIIGIFLLFDLRLVVFMGGTLQYILTIPLLIISGLYLITLLYLFPVYVHFDLKLLQYLKNALYIGTINIHVTILMTAVLVLLGFPLTRFPGLIPFFSVSSAAAVIMFGATIAFRRIENKQKKLIQKNHGS